MTAPRALLAALPALLALSAAAGAEPTRRPNLLWLSAEDLSPHHLGCYGGRGAVTPTLDGLARRGVRYTRAFTNAGVCAPSRTGIITGMMPTTLGANHMRSRATVPGYVRGIPAYLREAGYYCTNNAKTDYNLADFDAGWHESGNRAHWRNRPGRDRPFFAVFNFNDTHESKVFAGPSEHERLVRRLTPAERQDPAALDLPPIYPDTPVTRRDQADLHELATALDYWVADRLRELEEDGLLDDTVVVFWADHGDGLPRAKRWLYDSGTRIPLIVAIPEAHRVAGQGTPGTIDEGLVSGLDLGPTALNLAGAPIPDHMQGRAFLGRDLSPPRRYVYGARDRMDERYDLIRSVRDERFLYIRNFMPWKPYNQPVAYAEQEATMRELRRLESAGTLPENCRWFVASPKPVEELYDTAADPWQQDNLAGDSAHTDALARLRGEQDAWALRTRDAHLIPESILADEESGAGSREAILRGEPGRDRLRRLLAAARGEGPDDAGDPAVRFWNAHHHGVAGRSGPLMGRAATDPSATVRVAAAGWLGRSGHAEVALPPLTAALQDRNRWVVLAALTALDEMGEPARPALASLPRPGVIATDEYAARVVEHLRRGVGR